MTGCLGLTSSLSNASCCLPEVIVVQTTQHWPRRELPVGRRCIWSFWSARDALLNPLVGAGIVKVGHILFHDPVQMPFAQNQDIVEAFSSEAPQKTLTGSRRTFGTFALGALYGVFSISMPAVT